jgi:hypothetical protein
VSRRCCSAVCWQERSRRFGINWPAQVAAFAFLELRAGSP